MRVLFVALVVLALGSCSNSLDNKKEEAQNLPMEGITSSGYPYIFHSRNSGEPAKVGSRVTYHQKIQLNDSSIYSSYLQLQPKKAIMPEMVNLPDPVPPDYEALMMMAPGDCLTVIQQLDTFSASVLPRGVTNKDSFTYTMKVLRIQDSASVQQEINTIKAREKTVSDTVALFLKDYKKGSLKGQLTKTDTGVEYKILKKGSGQIPESGQFVKVNYSGHLQSDGSMFDNTFSDAQLFTFRFDRRRVIPAWDEMLSYMQEGDKAIVFIPYEQAYGVAGKPPRIPEKSNLVFFMELQEIVRFSQ
ncbi:MAG: hypothetical protein HKN16_01560 [Saprospiraceae bacterium]|nr:hypothetical protein [Saprospiraceae bacterium]